MEIRAGQRPPRSTPEDQTSLSFDRTSGKKCWKVFFNQIMEKKEKYDDGKRKINGRGEYQSSTPVVAVSRSKAVDKPWLQRCSFKEGVLHGVWYFYLFPPSARKVGGAKEKEKEIEINVHPLLPMVEMLLSKSQGRNYAHLKKCSRKYLMQTSELVVHSTTLHEAEAGHKRVSQ